jgi:hypothetical protein
VSSRQLRFSWPSHSSGFVAYRQPHYRAVVFSGSTQCTRVSTLMMITHCGQECCGPPAVVCISTGSPSLDEIGPRSWQFHSFGSSFGPCARACVCVPCITAWSVTVVTAESPPSHRWNRRRRKVNSEFLKSWISSLSSCSPAQIPCSNLQRHQYRHLVRGPLTRCVRRCS